MMFGVVLRVIGSNLEEKWFLAVFGQKAWTNPLGFLVKISNLLKPSVLVKGAEK